MMARMRDNRQGRRDAAMVCVQLYSDSLLRIPGAMVRISEDIKKMTERKSQYLGM